MLPVSAVPTVLKKQQNSKDYAFLNVPVRLNWQENGAPSILEQGHHATRNQNKVIILALRTDQA